MMSFAAEASPLTGEFSTVTSRGVVVVPGLCLSACRETQNNLNSRVFFHRFPGNESFRSLVSLNKVRKSLVSVEE